MKVLFIYKQFPAPAVGHAGGVAVFRLMEALHRHGVNLSLVARVRDEERVFLPQVRALCERVYTVPHHRSLRGVRPLTLARSYWALRRMADRAVREVCPDWVHLETTQTATALLGVTLPRTSFRTQDVNWFLKEQQAAHQRGWRRGLTLALAEGFRRFEPWLYRRFDVLAAISEGDRQLLASQGLEPLLLPLAPHRPPEHLAPAVTTPHNLLFVGDLRRKHNLDGVRWFLDAVWPRIQRTQPETHCYLVGGHPPAWLQARADGKRLFVTGFVDDLAAWYRAADVFISPLLVAGGLLQKLVDALAMGVPVVATPVCNHGLGAKAGEHLLLAENAGDFAEAVLSLLRDADFRRHLGEAGRDFVNAHYDPFVAEEQWFAALRRPLAAN